MDDGDGGFTMELQAKKIADNLGKDPLCPQCGVVINPIVYMYNKGLCIPCYNAKLGKQVKRGMF